MLANSESRRIFCRKINSDGVSRTISSHWRQWSERAGVLLSVNKHFSLFCSAFVLPFVARSGSREKSCCHTRDYSEALRHEKCCCCTGRLCDGNILEMEQINLSQQIAVEFGSSQLFFIWEQINAENLVFVEKIFADSLPRHRNSLSSVKSWLVYKDANDHCGNK